jgi:hypothetical protein
MEATKQKSTEQLIMKTNQDNRRSLIFFVPLGVVSHLKLIALLGYQKWLLVRVVIVIVDLQ